MNTKIDGLYEIHTPDGKVEKLRAAVEGDMVRTDHFFTWDGEELEELGVYCTPQEFHAVNETLLKEGCTVTKVSD